MTRPKRRLIQSLSARVSILTRRPVFGVASPLDSLSACHTCTSEIVSNRRLLRLFVKETIPLQTYPNPSRVRKCAEVAKWQTRWIQNPVPLTGVRVRLPPSALSRVSRFHRENSHFYRGFPRCFDGLPGPSRSPFECNSVRPVSGQVRAVRHHFRHLSAP